MLKLHDHTFSIENWERYQEALKGGYRLIKNGKDFCWESSNIRERCQRGTYEQAEGARS